MIRSAKVPKSVRKGPIVDVLNSPGGQVILAEFLTIIAAAFALKHTDKDSAVGDFVRHPAKGMKRVGRSARSTNGQASERLSRAFAQGLQAFRAALDDEGLDDAGLPENEGYAKKSHRGRTPIAPPRTEGAALERRRSGRLRR